MTSHDFKKKLTLFPPSSRFVALLWTTVKYDVTNLPPAACSVIYRDEFFSVSKL